MITSIEIENFKCFTHVRLPLAQLTLLTGFNGGGKSTALQPMLLLAQGLRASPNPNTIPLNGSLVRLGTVGDVIPAGSSSASTTFRVSDDRGESAWAFQAQAGDRFLRVVEASPVSPRAGGPRKNSPDVGAPGPDTVVETIRRLVFLSAVREGPADGFMVPDIDASGDSDVGFDGRFAAYWYQRYADEPVLQQRRHPAEEAASLRKQLDAWLATLFPGSQANAFILPQVPLVALQFRTSAIAEWRRPANVGYGFTYAFPLLVALLTATEGQVVIIDSPEAHLHPSAQSQMGQLLAHFAGAGVQIVVETHSDHLLNGVRLAVLNQSIAHDSVRIHFFSGAQESTHGVHSPSLDAEGRIYEWPDGFFDQSERDLARLAGWA